jgi:hypothetical protein
MRICNTCCSEKAFSEYYLSPKTGSPLRICKECHKEKMRIRRESMRDILALKQKEYRKRKPDVCRQAALNWKEKNKEKVAEYHREYYWKTHKRQRVVRNARQKRKLASDTSFKMRDTMTRRILLALKTQGQSKKCSAVKYLGCSIDELKNWLQSKFTRKMNWQNHGSYWHIDHVIPCDSFDLSEEKQAMACFHFTNLQPLTARENIKKGNKITTPQMALMI